MTVIEFKDVYFKYNHNSDYILRNASFLIKSGEKVGIVGDNGSGKSTITKILLGIYGVEKGSISIRNTCPSFKDKMDNISYIGDPSYEIHMTGLPSGYTVSDVLRIQELEIIKKNGEIDHSLEAELGVNDILSLRTNSLSTGQRKRLMICLALRKSFDLLIADEPLNGLDKLSKQKVIESINFKMKDGSKSLLYISHDLMEVEMLTSRTIKLDNQELKKIERPVFSLDINNQVMGLNSRGQFIYLVNQLLDSNNVSELIVKTK